MSQQIAKIAGSSQHNFLALQPYLCNPKFFAHI